MSPFSQGRSCRVMMVSLALTLLSFSLWISIPELLRSRVYELPVTPEAGFLAAASRTRALWAARLSVVRGDLWSEASFTYSPLLWPDAEKSGEIDAPDGTRATIEQALRNAPHRSGVWLLLASLAQRFDWPPVESVAALKMSFYTAPNDLDLFPLRLLTATRSNALGDPDVAQLVRRDIQLILLRLPELKTALAVAYNEGTPNAKTFIESVVGGIDAAFLNTLQHPGGRRLR